MDQDSFQKGLEAFLDYRMKNGGNAIWNPFLSESMGGGGKGGGGGGTGGGNKPPKTGGPGPTKDPKTPTPQWNFQPNPFDQSPYIPAPNGAGQASPVGNAAQYTVRLPREAWMLNPAGQTDYNNQWALPYY